MDFKERYRYNPKTDLLGKGGFARVFKAHDEVLQRYVALKVFSVEVSEKYDLVSEIRKVIGFDQTNLCRYYDVAFINGITTMGEEEKLQVGIMEYLDGGDLKTYCRTHPEQQLKLLTDVLKGLSFLHKRGIIHRDLKPQNILIKNTEDGPVAKITDFGISKDVGGSHTSSSLLMGTIEYMAPEQFSPGKYGIDGKIGTNLDLWSFGLMVYELVTGESLFGSRGGNSSAEQVMGNILSNDLLEGKMAKLPEPYLSVVRWCLIKDAKQRVQRADELIALINSTPTIEKVEGNNDTLFLPRKEETINLPKVKKQNEPVHAVQTTQTKSKSKNRSGFYIAGTLVIVLALGLIYGLNKGGTKPNLVVKQNANDSTKKLPLDSVAEPAKYNAPVVSADKLDLSKWSKHFDAGSNLIAVQENGKWGFVDKTTGKIVIPVKYDRVSHMFLGNADVYINCPNGVKHGVMSKTGEVKKEMRLESVDSFMGEPIEFHNGLACFGETNNGKIKYGFVNEDGEGVIPFVYDEAGKFSEGLAAVKRNNKWGFIDVRGKGVSLFNYEGTISFKDGVAGVYNGQRWGLIDKTGQQVVPFVSDGIETDNNGRIILNINKRKVIMDKNGKEVEEIK